VIGKARTALGGDPQLIHYLAVPPVGFCELTKVPGQHDCAERTVVAPAGPWLMPA
jgi:glucose-6-phosphate 1-dehydrogenase